MSPPAPAAPVSATSFPNLFPGESCFLFSFQPQFPCALSPLFAAKAEKHAHPGCTPHPRIPRSWGVVTAARTAAAGPVNPLPVVVNGRCAFNSSSHRPPAFARTSCPPKPHLPRGRAGLGWAAAGRAVAAAASVSPSPPSLFSPFSDPQVGVSTGGTPAAGRAGVLSGAPAVGEPHPPDGGGPPGCSPRALSCSGLACPLPFYPRGFLH